MKRALTLVGAALAAITMVAVSPVDADAAPAATTQQSHSEVNQLAKRRHRVYIGGGVSVSTGGRRRRRRR